MQAVGRVFNFKEIPKERKVKLVALKLRNYTSFGTLICVPKELDKEK